MECLQDGQQKIGYYWACIKMTRQRSRADPNVIDVALSNVAQHVDGLPQGKKRGVKHGMLRQRAGFQLSTCT